MADSLVLTGVKDVKKHTGTEMVRLNPKGGGDTFQLRRWWVEGGVSAVYVSATVFSVTTAAGTVKLALDTKGEGSRVRIDHDGSFNFSFFGMGEISRAALFTDAFELIEHYVFPSISGGQVMTVTPAGSADRPTDGPSATSITGATASGDTTADDGDTKAYTVSVAGDAGNLTYQWGVGGDASIDSGATSATAQILFNYSSGTAGVTCVVTSGDANVTGSPKTSNTVTVTVASP